MIILSNGLNNTCPKLSEMEIRSREKSLNKWLEKFPKKVVIHLPNNKCYLIIWIEINNCNILSELMILLEEFKIKFRRCSYRKRWICISMKRVRKKQWVFLTTYNNNMSRSNKDFYKELYPNSISRFIIYWINSIKSHSK